LELKNLKGHDRLFALADIVTTTGHYFTPGCLQRCNWYPLDNTDLLLTTPADVRNGMEQTIAYARSIGVLVRMIGVKTQDGNPQHLAIFCEKGL